MNTRILKAADKGNEAEFCYRMHRWLFKLALWSRAFDWQPYYIPPGVGMGRAYRTR